MVRSRQINRRDFLGSVVGAAAGLALPHISTESPFAAIPLKNNIVKPKAKVAITSSQKTKAEDLTFTDIKIMVTQAVELAGGLKGIVKDGQVVVLKPNLMCLYINSTGEKLTPNINGVTTDWRVTKAVAQLIRELNPNGRIYVMESSAFQQTRTTMAALNYTPEKIPEVDSFVCIEESGKYEQWNSPKLQKVTLPHGIGLYPDYMKPNKSAEFYFNKLYYNADVIISMPVLKNHHYAAITGAIKNVAIGSSPPNIYGSKSILTVTQATPKYVVDKWGPLIRLERSKKINHDPYYLSLWMHDYYLCKPVHFVVTDGLQGSQNGPDIPGTTKQKCLKDNQMNMRLILAGKDPLAVDTIHSLVIGFDPDRVNHLVNLSASGCVNPAFIRVNGSAVHNIRRPFALEGGRENAMNAKHSSFKPPKLKIEGAKVRNNKLNLHLIIKPHQTVKAEVAVDGKVLDKIVVDNFENVTMDLHSVKTRPKKITVYAYDHFLNCTEKTVTIS
jgi:uncharacterized protein (DUF362 family)